MGQERERKVPIESRGTVAHDAASRNLPDGWHCTVGLCMRTNQLESSELFVIVPTQESQQEVRRLWAYDSSISPEFREPVDGVVARVVEPSGRDDGSLLPLKERVLVFSSSRKI